MSEALSSLVTNTSPSGRRSDRHLVPIYALICFAPCSGRWPITGAKAAGIVRLPCLVATAFVSACCVLVAWRGSASEAPITPRRHQFMPLRSSGSRRRQIGSQLPASARGPSTGVYARCYVEDEAGTLLPRGPLAAAGCDRELRVQAIPARSERVGTRSGRYAANPHKASQKYVRGFRTARRREATMEFVPR